MLTGYTKWPKEFADRYREERLLQQKRFGVMLESEAEKYGDQLQL